MKRINKLYKNIKKFLSKKKNQRKTLAVAGVLVIALLVSGIGLLNSHRLGQEARYRHQLQSTQQERETLQSDLKTLEKSEAKTERQLEAKAKAQKELQRRIDDLNRKLQAKLRRESLLAKTVNVVTNTQPVYAESAGIPGILIRIRGCESGHNYTAENPDSTASGAYQFLDSTWAGYKGYSRAMHAPPALQDERAIMEYEQNGTTPWVSSQHCWG